MDDERMIGRRLREIRSWRGLSLTVTAELAGLSAGYLSRIERGLRPVQRRSTLEALASALQVSPSEITGQPYAPSTESEAVAHSAAPALRAVLRDIELGEPLTAAPRALGQLRGEVAAVNAACAASDYGTLGDTVPDLLSDLHTLTAGQDSSEARRLLADTLHAAFYLAKDLGHGDLAWMVAGHLHATAQAIGEPEWTALADFVRAHATVGLHARERGLALAERSADALTLEDGPVVQVYGMLHLSAALQSAVTGAADSARAHLAEAADTAHRTGDGTFGGLHFGPRNVGVWRVALTLELGEPGRVVELARDVDVGAIPSTGRQATFYGDVGRGLATIRGRETQAVEALCRAEVLAPERTRHSPYVRETVTDLLRRARRDAGGRELRGMAYRIGLAV
ncbi:MAG: helix-turn-helix domain-containing protein [Pseudonocardiaceae bacterium]|nr:helix-turn-helix domain-containing protein [Pseudonocardiaceae bacterium]